MAGAGIKKGLSYGQTDEFGYNIIENPVHVHDFQATLMHLMGIDHEKFTFKFQGRRYRLTDVHAPTLSGPDQVGNANATVINRIFHSVHSLVDEAPKYLKTAIELKRLRAFAGVAQGGANDSKPPP